MTIEEYCQEILEAYEVMDPEELKPILEATMDAVVKPAFENGVSPEDCCDEALEYYYTEICPEDEEE